MARRRLDTNIRDVADRAGVSATTVSHALNERGRVHPATRERIRRLAAEMGYVPNPRTRGLRTTRAMAILADVPGSRTMSTLRSASIAELLVGATQKALESGYLLTAASRAYPEPRRPPRRDGVLVIDPDPDHALPAGTPLVCVGLVEGSDDHVPSVYPDHESGIVELLEHLRASGFERPAFLTPRRASSFWLSSLRTYKTWTTSAGIPADVEFVDRHPDFAGGREGAARLLARERVPDVIVAASERLAEGAAAAIADARLRLPKDIGLASIGDCESLRNTGVPVTALDVRPAELGRRAVELLMAVLDSPELPKRRLAVKSELVIRPSTTARVGTPA